MPEIDPDAGHAAKAQFAEDLAAAKTPEGSFAALFRLSDTLCPVRLWTVMTVDLDKGVAQRAFSNRADVYHVSGTKPIVRNAWFDTICGQRQTFVANTLDEIAAVFPDFELIASLGCGSVMNLPVFEDETLLATVNLLDVEGHFTPSRIRMVHDVLATPALSAMQAARKMS
ncbi:GAF domain-containing protein [Jannaschia pohangensis]|uniref:GAF domain-containing protein n=1 Tax=Jannaschia pohangensis TaxID=390807 RepID=A0A1I3MZE8_9RHOB|nr:GAF domain-containing protein [Jannaschia pohangensis]SFJ02351.1 hypothetical protein SAMN04488095_2007 [Jannaschia pohangensis]